MIDTPACVKCRRALWVTELEAGRWACERCEAETVQHLLDLPHVFRRISQLSALMKGSSPGGIGSPNREAPAPLKIGVLNLTAKGGVVTQLQAIEDAWRQSLGWSMGPTRHHTDIAGVTSFLTSNVRWACERYDEVGDDLRKIANLHGQLAGIDTGTPPPKRFEVYCATDECPGVMRISLDTRYATCPECRTAYEGGELRRLDNQYDRSNRAAA